MKELDAGIEGRAAALSALRESETRFRATFEQAAVGMAHVAPDGSWIRVNQRLCDILGYSREELLACGLAEITHPEEREPELAQLRGVLQRNWPSCSVERRCVRKDRSIVWINLTVSLARRGEGRPEYLIAVIEDISARRRAQEELQRLNAELDGRVRRRTAALEQALADLETFSYTVSHDLRAPLRAMQGYAQLLSRRLGGRLDSSEEGMFARISESARRMDRLIQDVLIFSRMSKEDARLARIELDRLLDELMVHYPQLRGADIRVRRPLAPVLACESLLSQAIANLLHNALKFVSDRVEPSVELWTELSGRRVRLNVQDNGIGIDPAFHERIFQPFVRAAANGPYVGTGIGLAIVKKAVERMSGRVGVESGLGRGSRFWIELGAA